MRIGRITNNHDTFAEQLDFIINYDIKHRLGRDTGGEED